MEMRRATARIQLPNDAVKLSLDNDSPYLTSGGDTPVEPDGRYELVIEGYINTDETLLPGEPDAGGVVNERVATMLRGDLIPTSFHLAVIG